MNFRDKMQITGWLCVISALIMFLGAIIIKAQVPYMDINATGCVTIDIVTSGHCIALREANGKVRIIDMSTKEEEIFQLPKIPLQSICWFSKTIIKGGKWAVMINSIEGTEYRCQIFDIDGKKYLDVDGQGGPPNNMYLTVTSYCRVRVYKTQELKIMPTGVKPKFKINPLKSVVLRNGVYDSRGIVVSKNLLPSGFYIDLKNKNKIIFIK